MLITTLAPSRNWKKNINLYYTQLNIFYYLMLICSTSAHNQNRDYVILIMYTQLNE
jgi:hypothetical protein